MNQATGGFAKDVVFDHFAFKDQLRISGNFIDSHTNQRGRQHRQRQRQTKTCQSKTQSQPPQKTLCSGPCVAYCCHVMARVSDRSDVAV